MHLLFHHLVGEETGRDLSVYYREALYGILDASLDTLDFFKCYLLMAHFNSRGANGVLNAIFPFWAKMKIIITASCDDLCDNFLTRN